MRTLVVVSLEAWDQVWRRNQHLVAGLLADDPDLRVLFVEPPADPLHGTLSGRGARRGTGLRAVRDRLWALEPTKWLPRVAGPAADATLRGEVRAALRRLGWSRPVLWLNDPRWSGLAERGGWAATVYDVTDDWLRADRPARELARLERAEAVLLGTCDAVIVCSPALVAAKGARRHVELVPNAVDLPAYDDPGPRPADLPPGPTAVYVGTLHEDRLDVGLTCELAAVMAGLGGHLVLVGPDALGSASDARLTGAVGLVRLGARPREAVPSYLTSATVLVVPHVVDDFTDSLDPIKAYEYLAARRPVVTTPVAGFRELAGPGMLVAAPADLPAALAEAVRHPPEVPPVGVPGWAERSAHVARVLAPFWT